MGKGKNVKREKKIKMKEDQHIKGCGS